MILVVNTGEVFYFNHLTIAQQLFAGREKTLMDTVLGNSSNLGFLNPNELIMFTNKRSNGERVQHFSRVYFI